MWNEASFPNYKDSLSLVRSTSGKIGEQDISAKEKKIAEEDLKLNYCGMCFTIVVSTFSIHFGDFPQRAMKENV